MHTTLQAPAEAAEAVEPTQFKGSTRWRWSVVGLLFLATVLNYLDRQTLSISATAIQKEFDLTREAARIAGLTPT